MKQEIEKMKSRLLLLAFILMVPIGVFAQNITVKGNVTDSENRLLVPLLWKKAKARMVSSLT